VLPFHILAREKNKTLTSNEKLMIRVIIDFLIKIQKVNEHEYENQSEILISLFKNHNSKKIAEFVHQPHNISMEDVYQKMSKKDVFFKTLLLKHLFRCSLYGKIVSIENEKIILETAQKLGINKAAFNKRKFFCEKAGYQFESRRKQGFHFVQNVSRLTEIEALRVLELETSASTAEIKNAKRRLSKLYHPDKACCKESSIDKFIEITEAYELLKTLRGFK
jgi:DnaJ-domain-containing protein 1